MTQTPSTPSTPARVARRTGLLVIALVAGVWLLADAARGEDPAKPAPPRAVLNLIDGGVVPGELVDSDLPKAIRWKADPFASPFDFSSEAVRSVRFPALEKPNRAAGAFGFKLAGGDLVFGSIVGLDDKVAELDVARLGRIRVDRERVRQVFRWKDGADLIYNGPNGLAGWREFTPPKAVRLERANPPAPAMNIMINGNINGQAPAKPKANPVPLGPAWVDDGGPVHTSRDGATIQANVGLPTRSSIEIELSWQQSPDFVLALGVSDDEKTVARAFRLEVWEGQLVALRELDKEADIAPIQPAALGSGRVHLQLYLDQELGRLLVFTDDGRAVADLKIGARSGPTLPEIRLTNIRGDVRLEQFRVGRWDGETPRPVGANESRVQLTDSSVIRGSIDHFDAATREFVFRGEKGEESRAPEDRVEGIYLARPEDDAPRSVRLVYQDGTQLSGEWAGVEGGKLVLSVPGIAGSLRVAQEGLRALDVLGSVARPRDKDELVGTLEMDGLKLFGRLVDSSGKPGEGGLAWQPLGSESPASLRPGASGRIAYRTTPPVVASKTTTANRQPAQAQVQVQRVAGGMALQPLPGANQPDRVAASLPPTVRKALYLRSGDIIPVEVTKIDEKGVSFQTPLSESGFVPNDRIKAVELASENPSSIRVNKAKFERLLTLPRMQKDSPPTHLIRSKNGDILRGRVINMDDKTIGVEIRLEEKVIPRDRISRIIWLHADETDPSKKVSPAPELEKSSKVQAVRSDGIRLTFHPERFEAGILIGQSEVLGVCKVRPQELDQLLIGDSVEKEATQLAYQNFKLQNATEPKAVQFENSGTPGGGSTEGTEAALVGKPAPDFTLELLGGPKFHLAENKGHVVVLDFWATWCGPCIQAMPQIDKVTREFADQGVQLIAVNLQEGPEKIKAMLERQKLNPTVALDRDGVVAEKYGANAIPQTVVIDREGKVTRLFIGGGPRLGDQLREALQAALKPAGPPEPGKP